MTMVSNWLISSDPSLFTVRLDPLKNRIVTHARLIRLGLPNPGCGKSVLPRLPAGQKLTALE